MAQQKTSGISKVRIGSGQGASDLFIKTKLTKTNRKNSDGTPIFTKEIIKYNNAKGEGEGVVIATGSSEDGASNLSPTSNISTKERSYLNSRIRDVAKVQIDDASKKFDNLTAEDKQAISDVSGDGNNAIVDTDSSASGGEGGSTPAGSTLADIRNIESADGTNAGIPKETTRYPIDIADTKQDIMQFDMLEYTPSLGADQKNFGSIQRPSASGEAIATTFLSVPGNIQDQNSANWGGGEMNPLQVEALKLAYATISSGTEGAGDYLSDAKTKLEGMGGEIKSGIAAYFAGQAVGVGQQALQRTSGAVLNPNLELLFNGPSLRPFTFNFLLAPRSEKESQAAVNVIRFFKVGMSPIRSKSNLFLKTPNTFRIKYLHRGDGDSEHRFLNKFKECALLSVGVNYTPNTNYATFTDGGMVAYQLTLSFQELEPVFNDDYKNDNSIGF
tara:strand:+ start:76 stop:1407 length:1332 start_codon:yes stop_codon:yes gene_type:complete